MSHATKEQLGAAATAELNKVLQSGKALTPKDRLALPAQEMPAQAPEVRVGNILEVALGYTPEQARVEAMRCLQSGEIESPLMPLADTLATVESMDEIRSQIGLHYPFE